MFDFVGNLSDLESLFEIYFKTDAVNLITHQGSSIKGQLLGVDLVDNFSCDVKNDIKRILIYTESKEIDGLIYNVDNKDFDTVIFNKVDKSSGEPIELLILFDKLIGVPPCLKIYKREVYK